MFAWADLAVIAMLVALICGAATVAREWSGPLKPVAEIHLEPRYIAWARYAKLFQHSSMRKVIYETKQHDGPR